MADSGEAVKTLDIFVSTSTYIKNNCLSRQDNELTADETEFRKIFWSVMHNSTSDNGS